jgi:hypothetical protein
MDNDATHSDKKGERRQRMIQKAIYFEPDIWDRARQKAGLTPLAAIIRRLVELWLKGKIDLDKFDR